MDDRPLEDQMAEALAQQQAQATTAQPTPMVMRDALGLDYS